MAALSDYLENALVNHIFRNTDYVRVANIYVALFTAAPSDAGGGTEVTGGAYARQALATGASSAWDAASGGATANTATLTFPTATANWGTITHIGLFDALTVGNLMFHGALTVAKTVNNFDIFRFNAGDLDASLA